MKHFNRRVLKWMDNLHIGPLLLNHHVRYIGKIEKSRQRLEFSWPNFKEDLEYISSRYDDLPSVLPGVSQVQNSSQTKRTQSVLLSFS